MVEKLVASSSEQLPAPQQLQSLDQNVISEISTKLAARLKDLGDSTLRTGGRILGLARKRRDSYDEIEDEIAGDTPDRLKEILCALYPNNEKPEEMSDESSTAYSIISRALTQVCFNSNIPQDMDGSAIYQAFSQRPRNLATFNQRRILGPNGTLTILKQLLDEEHPVSIAVTQEQETEEKFSFAKLRFCEKTDIGLRRKRNEDFVISHLADPEDLDSLEKGSIFIDADGMGGLEHGDIASRLASETIVDLFKKGYAGFIADHPQSFLINALIQANQAVYQYNPEGPGSMGTAIVIALIQRDKLFLAHMGDCRAYRMRDDVLELLTRDHSLYEETGGQGAKNILTKSIGRRPNIDKEVVSTDVVAVNPIYLQKGDKILLCTDGLWGVVDEKTIAARLNLSPIMAVDYLIQDAKLQGAPDNIGVTVINVEDIVAH